MVRAASKHRWIWFPAAALMVIAAFSAGCAHKPIEPPAGPDSQEPLKVISRISIVDDPGATVVRIEGLGSLAFTAVKRSDPPAVFFYFPNTRLSEDFTEPATAGALVESAKASEVAEEKQTVRVEVALKEDVAYEVNQADGQLRITFAQPAHTSESTSAVAAEKGQETIAEKTIAPLPAAAPPAPAATRLISVNADPVGNGVRIHVKADGQIGNYNDFTIDTPARIVFDIFDVKSSSKKEEAVLVNTPWVKQVRYYGDASKLRLVLDTRETYLRSYVAVPVADGLDIQVLDPGALPAKNDAPAGGASVSAAVSPGGAAAPPPAGKTPMEADNSEKPVVVKPLPAASVESPKGPPESTTKPAWVNEISFASEEAGKSTVTIGTTRPVQYQMKPVSDKLLRLTLVNTNIPEYRKRALITTRFESAVDRITPVQKPGTGDTSLMVFELREGVGYQVIQSDSLIRVHFAASAIPPKPFEAAKLPPWKKVLEQVEMTAGGDAAGPDVAPGKGTADYRTAEYAATRAVKQYTGEKIALDFYETDIKNVFRILREVSGKNFAIDKNVTGRVTLTLENPVPWDQILDLVLKMNQLGMLEEGDILRIATLATIRKEDEQRRAAFEAERQAQAAEKLAEPLVTVYIPVNYSNAKNEVLPHIKSVLSKRGVASVDMRNNQLIITDTETNIAQVRDLVKEIDKVTPQVLIEARVVEVNDSFVYEFGIEWGLEGGVFNPPIQAPDGQGSGAIVGVGPQRGYNTLGGTYNYFGDMNFPAAGAGSSIGFNFTRVFGSPLIINAIINAVETKSEGRIISSPKVLTLDNKKARIKQGLEFPYLERDDAGGSSVKFKNIDLLLEVTPQITPDNRISMNIFITKNDVATIIDGVPAISTNEAETELLVNDGDTIVIGGIMKASTTLADKGWPLLKDIPIVKWLFRTDSENKQNQELLIFITPRVVQLEQREI